MPYLVKTWLNNQPSPKLYTRDYHSVTARWQLHRQTNNDRYLCKLTSLKSCSLAFLLVVFIRSNWTSAFIPIIRCNQEKVLKILMWTVLSHRFGTLTLRVEENLRCDQANKPSSAVLWEHATTICLVGSSSIWVSIKSYGVTMQTKPLQLYSHNVFTICFVSN